MNEQQKKLFYRALDCLETLADEIAIDKDGKDYSDLWNAYISLTVLHAKVNGAYDSLENV